MASANWSLSTRHCQVVRVNWLSVNWSVVDRLVSTGQGKLVLLVLGEHSPSQGIGRGVVDELQHFLVVLVRVDEDGQDGPENLLQDQHDIRVEYLAVD